MPPTRKERSGRPLNILGSEALYHALLMQNIDWSLSWILRKWTETPYKYAPEGLHVYIVACQAYPALVKIVPVLVPSF